MVKRLRAAWRALFDPEPYPAFDAMVILAKMRLGGMTQEQALRERSHENLQRKYDWARGERF